MDDSFLVRRLEGVGDLADDRQRFLERESRRGFIYGSWGPTPTS